MGDRRVSSADSSTTTPAGWPLPLRLLVSVAIIFHLAALAGLVLSTRTGPWAMPDGDIGIAHAPFFAERIFDSTRGYRQALRLTEDYRFSSNLRPDSDNQVEIRLKDKDGKVIKTVLLPQSNSWLGSYQREQLIANLLSKNEAVDAPEGEKIPPPGQQVPMASYWKAQGSNKLWKLEITPEHLLPREEEMARPTDLSVILAKSLARHAQKKYGGESADVALRSKQSFGALLVAPAGQGVPNLNAEDFDPIEFVFGSTP